MNTFKELWRKLASSKKYREEFVAAQVKRGIPFQIRTLLKQTGWTQEELASRADLDQGVVSRAANPNYGNLTLNTIIRIAAGFDVAFIGTFVPFSKLGKWFVNLEESVRVKTFEEENATFASHVETEREEPVIVLERLWSAGPAVKGLGAARRMPKGFEWAMPNQFSLAALAAKGTSLEQTRPPEAVIEHRASSGPTAQPESMGGALAHSASTAEVGAMESFTRSLAPVIPFEELRRRTRHHSVRHRKQERADRGARKFA